jgi:hypothetical protein
MKWWDIAGRIGRFIDLIKISMLILLGTNIFRSMIIYCPDKTIKAITFSSDENYDAKILEVSNDSK